MRLDGHTVLVTGGASGIGLAFAERFLRVGSEVIVCGRRVEKLQEAKEKFPGLHTRVCDVASKESRTDFAESLMRDFPNLDVLVNNAGVQQRVNLLGDTPDWDWCHQEIAVNFDAPIHLTMLLLSHLQRQKNAAIINVSSGLALAPAAWAPIYCATKAALHSFTISLRLQLGESPVRVIEVLPPAVNTDLGGPGLHTFGAPVDDFADSVFADLERGEDEIGYGGTEVRAEKFRAEVAQASEMMWQRFQTSNPNFK